MKVLGIETSCDECSAAVVENGHRILSNVIATQIELHKCFDGVVPEIASRLHTQWIEQVAKAALEKAGMTSADVDAVAVTSRPGLLGSLLVGVNFAKAYAVSLDKPFIGIDHIRAHLYASQIENPLEYPYLGVLVSGGHTVICQVNGYDDIDVLGTTIDDAIGEAFDKVAKHYQLGYPGGVRIDRLAQRRSQGLHVSRRLHQQEGASLRHVIFRPQDSGDQPAGQVRGCPERKGRGYLRQLPKMRCRDPGQKSRQGSKGYWPYEACSRWRSCCQLAYQVLSQAVREAGSANLLSFP